jgi:TorA maturation chaperone TorD
MHCAELLRALAVLAEDAGEEQSRIADALGIAESVDAAAFTQLFVLTLYPYASVYLGPEGMMGGSARDRIAGFWHALSLDVPAEPDHLAALLALYARLSEDAEAAPDEAAARLIEHAKRTLFWEHLASWLPVYLARVRRAADGPYRRWADMLDALLCEEAARLGPPAPSQHLVMAPLLTDPRECDAQAFLAELLSPLRCGFLLTRDDLAEAARAIGAGLRQGERRYVITQMFGHDRDGMLAWLRELAQREALAHAALSEVWGPVRVFWRARAERSAALFAAA